MTQLPLLRSTTWPCANNGCFANVFGIRDGGDDGQGAGDAGRAMVVMVIVLVTVMVENVGSQSIASVSVHMSLKSGKKWNQAVEMFISLPMPGPGPFLQ